MSTRCSVEVKSPDCDVPVAQLYHHWSGHPGYMLDVIGRAYRHSTTDSAPAVASLQRGLQNAACYIVAADPIGFKIDAVGTGYFDTDYEYTVVVDGDAADQNWKVYIENRSDIGAGDSYVEFARGTIIECTAEPDDTPRAPALRTPCAVRHEQARRAYPATEALARRLAKLRTPAGKESNAD